MSDRYKGAILSPTAPTVTPQSAGGIYTSSQQLQYQGQGIWPTAVNNPINNSLRFRSSASAYLNRTPASAGNRRTWTWSGWVKRGVITGDYPPLFNAGQSIPDTVLRFFFDDTINATLENGGGGSSRLITTAVYRDPSAWYHIVWAVDTTQATADNRQRLYVNGVEITAFSTRVNPSQNLDTNVNNTVEHRIGGQRYPSYYDGYMAEINFVDGTQLTPSSFGTTDAYGIWQPIPYTGAYGTNGFYLPFTDNSALTTSSNVGLGKDFSGNGNYWVTNNISITAGSTYDSMKDVPTNTNSNTANYCVLNPLFKQSGNMSTTADGNLKAVGPSAGSGVGVFATIGPSTGKWYWEWSTNNASSSGVYAGMSNTDGSSSINVGDHQLGGFATTDTGMVAFDCSNGKIWFGRNGTWYQNSTTTTTGTPADTAVAYATLTGTPLFPYASCYSDSYSGNYNFGQRPFAYTPPSGFYPLNTYNLPTPTILAGNQYFDAVTRNGFGSSGGSVTSLNFQPDFWWEKARNTVSNHTLIDSIRGVTKELYSNLTNAESTGSNFLVSFNSNGFTMGSNDWGTSTTLVDWVWKAGGSGGVSNTQGTITSTVSANTTSGFSIVTYTGTGANATVGHGLGVAPKWVIVKGRNVGSTNWFIYTETQGATKYLDFSTGTGGTDTSAWNSSAPTSTVFSVGTSYYTNYSATTYVAYCFAQVAGYSAFGSYTGNGSTDGPFVFTGFRPRFIMFKNTTTGATNWQINDSARDTYNVVNKRLAPSNSDAEATNFDFGDFLSNGFKIRQTDQTWNKSGDTYIYACFAENPFKISRAR